MKRFIILILLIYSTFTIYSENPKFSRWSITPEYGYNYFDGDINQDLTNIFPTSFRDVTYGGTIEYGISPILGLSVDAFYFPLRAKNNSPVGIFINTDLYTSSLSATINFTRLVFPHSRSKFHVNGSLGLGLAKYSYDLTYINGDPVQLTDAYTDIKYNGTVRPIIMQNSNGTKMDQGFAASVPVTLSLEYNFSRPLAIGAKVHYRAYNKDNLEGVTYLNWNGVTNDFIAAGTLYLRVKFNSKGKEHIRDIDWDTFRPNKAMDFAKSLDEKINALTKRVDTVENKVDSILPRLERLEKMLSNDGPDEDGDGVPNVRDKSPNTLANTPVDFWGKPIEYSPKRSGARRVEVPNYDDVMGVYFDFDRIELDNDALITISKIAAIMKKDPTLYVEVRGYCDSMGSNPYNNLLSQRRSDRVKAELMKAWGIPFDHIISNGKGKIIEPRVRYKPNRRCDFFFGRL